MESHRTRRAIRPLTLALIQQNIHVYAGKYRPSNLTHTVVKRQTYSSSMQLTYNLSLYVAKLFSPFQCPNTYPVAVSRIRNVSVT